ncbi:MAG: DUF4397 domain-containing protein [Gemmatimonadaceae bacterium]
MTQHLRFARITRMPGFRVLAGIGMVAGIVAIGGCKLDNNLGPGGSAQGLIQFVNAAPRYGFVNLKVDSAAAFPLQQYATGASAYIASLANARQLTARDSANANTLAASPLLIANQSVYLVILTQRTTGGNLLVFPDTVSAPPANDVGLRLINVSPSAGPVDFYITGSDSTLATASATNVVYEGTSAYIYVPNTGVLRVRVTTAGTKNVLLDVDASRLTAGQARSIVLLDAVGGGLPATSLGIPDRG